MIFEFGEYKLDIDAARTRRFYETAEDFLCDCAGCRNFRKAVPMVPDAVHAFFRQFGVSIGNPAEMTAYVSRDGNTTYYGGFYHICGTILAGKDPWQEVGDGVHQLNAHCARGPHKDFSVFFTEMCALVEEDFPTPVIQMEVECHLPWVLEEPNPYFSA